MSPREKSNTKKVEVFLSVGNVEKLKQEAIKKGTSMSGLIRMIVLEHLNEQ